MSESTKAIFLSYASQDAAAARRICDALRTAGHEVWFDQSELRGGDAWDAAIRKQVKECALFMPLISTNTDARSEGYFRREWNLAVNRMLDMAEDQPFLMPVVLDDTSEMMARVPDRFRERQWTRLPDGTAPADFAERVTRLLAGARATAPTTPAPTAAHGEPARANEGFGVAVLPFKYRGANGDLMTLAEVLAGEIVTGLSRFSYLRVLAHGSTARYASGAADVRTIARDIGARYVIEGSLQQAGASLRVAVQLIDTTSGTHLWAETYTEIFEPDQIFKLQDELVARVVSTCGDRFGVLLRYGNTDASEECAFLRTAPLNQDARALFRAERLGKACAGIGIALHRKAAGIQSHIRQHPYLRDELHHRLLLGFHKVLQLMSQRFRLFVVVTVGESGLHGHECGGEGPGVG